MSSGPTLIASRRCDFPLAGTSTPPTLPPSCRGIPNNLPPPVRRMGYHPPRLLALAPAPPRPPPAYTPRVTFMDLPAELRIEIYKLALENVTVHILPASCDETRKRPHALTRTTRQVRAEVLPLMHALCPIRCSVTDFHFDSLLAWLARIPPDAQANLCKNAALTIRFCTTTAPPKSIDSMRRWLHARADPCRPQPRWQYSGSKPADKVCRDLLRRAKRMREAGRQREMFVILTALGVASEATVGRPRTRDP